MDRSAQKFLVHYDPVLLIIVALLLAFGLVMMTSASIEIGHQNYQANLYFFFRQLTHIGLGLLAMLVFSRLNLEILYRGQWWILFVGLMILMAVVIPGVGYSVNGAQRWIDLGFFRFHAGDTARVLILVFCAAYLASACRQHGQPDYRELTIILLVSALVSILLALQPDYGSLMIFLAMLMGLMFVAGMRLMLLWLTLGLSAMTGLLLLLSSPYRLRRLQGFYDPFSDPYDTGYQMVQSLIAIGRGKITGVGLGNSVQKMSFLPEAHNDFVFSILAEELGFVGVFVVIGLYLALVMKIMMLAIEAMRRQDHFAALLATAIAFWFAGHSIINMAVALDILPPKGVSLPLFSYGGSNMVLALMQVGLACAIFARNHADGSTNQRQVVARPA